MIDGTKKLRQTYLTLVGNEIIEQAYKLKIYNQPSMIALDEKEKSIKAELVEKQKKIDGYQNSPSQPVAKMTENTIEGLAKKRIDENKSIDDIETPAIETEKEKLEQQKRILHRALELIQEDRRWLKIKLIREGCEKLEPYAKGIFTEVIEAWEAVEKAEKKQEGFFALLSSCGFDTGLRPRGWNNSMPFELAALYGSASAPSLAWGLEQKRAECDFPLAGKNRKSV